VKPFDYRAPTSISEAVMLLAERDGRARPLAGGTDLLVRLRHGLLDLDLVVDIKKIPELHRISFDRVEGLDFGAAVSCASISQHPDVQRHYLGLVDAASVIGGPAIRERATLGGNLCNAAPSGDTIPPMIVLDAACIIVGPKGTRMAPVSAFCTAPGGTILERGEILVAIHFPPARPNSGACYLRFIPRGEMDIAVAGAGVWVGFGDGSEEIAEARVALAAVAPTPLLAEAAGRSLVGRTPSEETFAEAARLAQEASHPISDVRGSAAFRRHLVGVLVRRALREAVRRAKGVQGHD
jgi:CO/xanthine dehydrogenase FAD-binding subunit